jgi:hypothetical protein
MSSHAAPSAEDDLVEPGPDAEQSPTDLRRTATFYIATNVVTAAAFLVLGVTLAAFGLVYGLVKTNVPGPGMFPFVLGMLLILLTVLWTLMRKQRDVSSADEVPTVPDRTGMKYIGITLAAGVSFIALLSAAGYQLTMLLYIAVLLRFVSHRSWLMTAVLSVAFSFGSYLVFVALLGVPLPAAQLPFLNSLGL